MRRLRGLGAPDAEPSLRERARGPARDEGWGRAAGVARPWRPSGNAYANAPRFVAAGSGLRRSRRASRASRSRAGDPHAARRHSAAGRHGRGSVRQRISSRRKGLLPSTA
jgi:hypothetical protein